MHVSAGFSYEQQLPFIGSEAYFVVKYLPAKTYRKVFPEADIKEFHSWAQLTNLFVAKRHRRHGYGTALLHALQQWQITTQTHVLFIASPYAHGAGCKADVLHKFYSDNGYPQIWDTPYHYRRWTHPTTGEQHK